MYRLIIETEIFMAQVDDQRDKNLLEIIQQAVLADINLPPVNRDLIQGSGGFAKLRVADPKRSKVKSGG